MCEVKNGQNAEFILAFENENNNENGQNVITKSNYIFIKMDKRLS